LPSVSRHAKVLPRKLRTKKRWTLIWLWPWPCRSPPLLPRSSHSHLRKREGRREGRREGSKRKRSRKKKEKMPTQPWHESSKRWKQNVVAGTQILVRHPPPSLSPFLFINSPSPLPPSLLSLHSLPPDLALALQLQAEEERALNAARRAAAARDQLQQGQYSKVSVSYGIEEGGRAGGREGGRRVLLSADDAPDSSSRSRSSSSASAYQEEEEGEEGGEGGREGALGGLVGITGPGGGRRRRQKQGELWITKEGEVIHKHDATVNGRLNALELTARYPGVGDLEGEVSKEGGREGRREGGTQKWGFRGTGGQTY